MYIITYNVGMKRIHPKPPTKRIAIGEPFERAILEILMPKTNSGNISPAWDMTDWVRYCIAEQLKRAGTLPADCRAMLPRYDADLEL